MGLPAGTVTMLFSDMECSTRLLARLGAAYGDLLSAQRRLLRSAFGSHQGTEMGTEGDSFFVVFASAADAVSACAEGQRALAGHAWPQGVTPLVRMGLHSGEPTRHEDGYIGMDVHRAARIAASAHGGQVVMSEAARQLAAGQLADAGRGSQRGDAVRAAKLLGTAQALREQAGMPIRGPDAELLAEFLAPARRLLSADQWEQERRAGRNLNVQQALVEAGVVA